MRPRVQAFARTLIIPGVYDPRIKHTRGYIPHLDPGECTQFITFRLADSMPQAVLEKWRLDLKSGEITDAGFRKRIETYLDQNYGARWLSDPRIALLVQNALLNLDGTLYRLIAWVIMPNHLHMLIQTMSGHAISDIMQSIKSFTAHEANKMLGRKGHFWFKEYFDRYVRDDRHFQATVRYIEENPVKARLCKKPEDWKFSSAGYRKESL
jgi:REP element-mobilizing transposase RayT